MIILTFLLAFLGTPHFSLASSTSLSLTATQAYSKVKKTNTLANVTVLDVFDLSRLEKVQNPQNEPTPHLIFKNVVFQGGIVASGKKISTHLWFKNCLITSIAAIGTSWLGKISFDRGEIKTFTNLKKNIFSNEVSFYFVQFNGQARFTENIFLAPVEFLHVHWRSKVSFMGTTFSKPVKFNYSLVGKSAVFQAVTFEDDSSFIHFENLKRHASKIDAPHELSSAQAFFLNSRFMGDAEFRLCKFEHVKFSSLEHMSTFYKMADFRGCEMGSASFDYADFRGVANFAQTIFKHGGISFQNSDFGGKLTNFDGMQNSGKLNLTGAYMPTLQFQWSDIGKSILGGSPRYNLLNDLYRRLKDLGRTDQALELSYELEWQKDEETLEDTLVSTSEKTFVYLKRFIWGWPTGYGTKTGRIIVLSLLCWITSSLPILARKNIIHRIPTLPSKKTGTVASENPRSPKYQPLYLDHVLPREQSAPSFLDRLWTALIFTFALMFKTKLETIRYVEKERKPVGRHGFEIYFMVLWFLGSTLLALMAITIAKTSPLIRAC